MRLGPADPGNLPLPDGNHRDCNEPLGENRLGIPGDFDFIIAPAVSLGVLLLCLWLINLTRRSRVASTLLLGLPWKRAGK